VCVCGRVSESVYDLRARRERVRKSEKS